MTADNRQTDAKKLSEAKIVFNTLCSALDNRKWKYDKEEDKLIVRTGAGGKDLSIKFYIKVDAEREVMYLKSPMPFKVPFDRVDDMATATAIANWSMLNGCFEMDRDDGYCGFKVVVPFTESLLSERLCNYMINLSCNMVDKFNGKLMAIAENSMTVGEFDAFVKANS